VESERINFLLNSPTDFKSDDIFLLEQEIDKYPYAQILHILLAKIKHQQNSGDKNKKLTLAAIYSSDRSILKRTILENGYLENYEEIVPFQDLPKFELEDDQDEIIGIYDKEGENESATIFDEVLKNLEKLKSLRRQFQFLELNDEPDQSKSEDSSNVKEIETAQKGEASDKPVKKATTKKSTQKIESNKRKLDKILEKDEILDSQVNLYLLNEIEEKKAAQKKEETEKLISQSKIIEKFIEKQPSIGSVKKEIERSQDEINKDLSEKSTKFGDDLISENLAIILLKQGKRERAIDIYKKLIWKLPQKKAYFAARIEEIKK